VAQYVSVPRKDWLEDYASICAHYFLVGVSYRSFGKNAHKNVILVPFSQSAFCLDDKIIALVINIG
jgi:hypothetical protein